MLKIAVIASVSVLAAVSGAKALSAFGDNQARAQEPERIEVMTTPAPISSRGARIKKSDDGHYWADARVNGSRVHFLVDTGATSVALKAEDARRLGISTANLDYNYEVSTANGPAFAAHVVLDSVNVDGVKVKDVDAFVVAHGLDTSLLGMSYLGRLSGFEATSTSLVLNP